MPALDACHPHVVNALVKDGWTVDRDPFRLLIGRRSVFIDLEVSNPHNDQRILLIEVKCFPDRESTTRDLYTALGQYLIYRAMLAQANSPFPLYLSIPADVFATIFDASVLKAVADNRIQLVMVDLDSEVVTQWIR
jgi:hypothetical protein